MLDETAPVPDHTALAEARESLRWNGSLWDAILTYHRVADEQAAKKSAERPTQHDKPREAEQALATTEAELDGLPPFTMILDNEGDRLVKLQNGRWRVIADETWIPYRANEIALPVTILHTPEGNK